MLFARLRARRALLPLAVGTALVVGAAGGAGAAAGSGGRHRAHDVTTINGEVPPGVVTRADVTLLLRQPLGGGRVLYQYRSARPVGTRAPIHTHPFGGSSCVLRGESTLRIDGVPGARANPAGTCYYMPSGPLMVNLSSGTEPLVVIDTFVLRKGEVPWTVAEPGHDDVVDQFGT